ncbi:Stk1 family PASTA domain-containing Ser/Thr kinase [Salininema proteolyticum]|uniref:non-specific serine/threonine protein kinase n=1 Tax=Salininema proteolyticum TaxID=1607685 RepID=A0ABV8U299_9ACTN
MESTTGVEPGTIVDGRYRLGRLVASGGMAEVWEAFDERLDRTVAVKLINPESAAAQAFSLDAFEHEAKTVAAFSHPNVVAVFDSGRLGEAPYIVMEYVDGGSLRDRLSSGALPVGEAVSITRQILDGLQAAHAQGLVHRDIKPENILLKADGKADRVKIVDFGLAQGEDGTGPMMATPAYVAPEVLQGRKSTPASDVYSVAIVLYELLCGRTPYNATDFKTVVDNIEGDIPSPRGFQSDVPERLAQLTMVAASSDPDVRPVNAAEFSQRLAEATGATTQIMQTMAVPEQRSPARSVWRARSTLAAMTVIAVLAVAVVWWVGFGRYVSAPSMLDQSVSTVEEYAEGEGFTAKIADGEYSESVPKGDIIYQDPGVGDRVKDGGVITVVPSLGPERFTVPDVTGDEEQAAVDRLEDLGATVKVEKGFSDDVDEGKVVGTDPGRGESIRIDDTVTVTVSKGSSPYKVPDVVGKDVEDAEEELREEDLEVGEIGYAYSDSIDEGEVISTRPGSGAGVERGTAVDLVVSEGPEPVEVPDVEGETLDDAVEIMEDAGFEVKEVNLLTGGYVFKQSVEPGEMRPKGTEIWLWAR